MGLLDHLFDRHSDDRAESARDAVVGPGEVWVTMGPVVGSLADLDKVDDLVVEMFGFDSDSDADADLGVGPIVADFRVPSAESSPLASGVTAQDGSEAVSRYAIESLGRIGQRAGD